jgi:zinc protease
MKSKCRMQNSESRNLNMQTSSVLVRFSGGPKISVFQNARDGMRLLSVVILLVAGLAASGAQGQAPDRSHPPQLGPPPTMKLKPIQHLKLSNGLPVLLYEKHEVPLVQMNLVLNTGAVQDPRGKGGLASMTAAMMTEGAGTRTALELADAIDYLGADLHVAAGQHTSAVVLHTPLAKLDSALALMADVTLRPTFAAAELDRKRKERLTILMQWRDEPRSLASVTFNRMLYGDHPYGRYSIGDEKALRSFTPADLKDFYQSGFGPNNATLIVVGDIVADALLPRLEKAFGAWKNVKHSTPELPKINQVTERRVILVDKPGAAQSEIRIGRIGVPRLTEDYYAVVVMNTVLGGSFSSRLNQNLREKHGYTYGAGSRFDYRPLPGPFMASAAVQTAVTDSSLFEFMKELKDILQPVPKEELERAKNYVALSFPGEFQTVRDISGRLEELVIYGLPDNYFNDYIGHILAVTREDVQRVAQKYLDPEKVDIVVVGDRKQIEKNVAALKLGPMTVMSVEDVLGKAPVLGEK